MFNTPILEIALPTIECLTVEDEFKTAVCIACRGRFNRKGSQRQGDAGQNNN